MRNMDNKRLWLWLIVCLLALSGCSSTRERTDLLEATQRAYLGTLRWGGIDSALGFLEPDENRPAPPPWYGDLRVTSYRILAAMVAEDGMSATQSVELRYVHIDYQRELALVDKQQWVYNEARQHWYLASGLPAFEHP